MTIFGFTLDQVAMVLGMLCIVCALFTRVRVRVTIEPKPINHFPRKLDLT